MPLFHCKYKGFMPLFQDLRLHKLPFFQFSNSIQMHALYAHRRGTAEKLLPVAAHGKINRVTTYGEKIGYNDEHSTTLISSMKIAIKNIPSHNWKHFVYRETGAMPYICNRSINHRP